MIKVSIIVPIYNTEEYLEKCVESLVNQTLKEIEIILVDDGSTDRSYEIAQKFAQNDERVIVLRQENSGQSAARNKGLEIARGEYIGFADSDDWVDLDYFEKLYEATKKENADFGVAGRRLFNENYEKTVEIKVQNKVQTIKSIPDYIIDGLLYPHTVVVYNKIYKRNIIEDKKIRFESVNVVGSEDTIFNYCYILNSKKFIEVPGSFYNGVERDGSTTRKYKEGCIKRTSKLLEKIYFYSKKFERENIADEVAIIFLVFFQQWNYNYMKNYGGEKLNKVVEREHLLTEKSEYLKKVEKETVFNKKSKYYLEKLGYKWKGIIFMKIYFLASYLNFNKLAGKIRALS